MSNFNIIFIILNLLWLCSLAVMSRERHPNKALCYFVNNSFVKKRGSEPCFIRHLNH